MNESVSSTPSMVGPLPVMKQAEQTPAAAALRAEADRQEKLRLMDQAALLARIIRLEQVLVVYQRRLTEVERPVRIESSDGTVEVSQALPKVVDLRVDIPSVPVVAGTRALYLVPVCREYDAAGALVAIGSETGATGRVYQETWDFPRLHD